MKATFYPQLTSLSIMYVAVGSVSKSIASLHGLLYRFNCLKQLPVCCFDSLREKTNDFRNLGHFIYSILHLQ